MADISSVPDPLWYRDAVIYQLHVKSFADSNDDGVGDFKGLLGKLDYIAELGVDTVWLLPFYPSPWRDDGYDIADYRGIHPEYGSFEDAKEFIEQAHAKGLKIITELVLNHTSSEHPWFQAARRADQDDSIRDFYVWSDSDQRYPDTRIIFLDAEKSNWAWDPVANAYFWHRFYSHQPDLNFDNPSVLHEMLEIMRFWLDLGVDGLRLDAVPYLIEREGTGNENLPETHEILKKIRSTLDARYQSRMLLAEANMWPEDTQQYFGNGDECHMAFHFPLMPRMYMAIAQEDRFPITDILRQTPDIPEGCQWAIFLRNHDELTLEMVTDKERDYLWTTYAADRRARLNLGIRRRLSPLLERDRRRVELMNGLLLSMPGTPVIYYGDEIGMGDNIYLGDRDGVRTPMHWSPDRNGGFSKADPARLVLPLLQDPLYGYQSINVEAQSRDAHSLLNWMRRMLAIRKRSRAFGRGSMRLLYPGNRKVLAYLREHEDDTILCIFNLSRSAQAVELDLAAFSGRVPIEMLGGTAFPPIGQLTYLLTLPPFGFYWFLLALKESLPPWHVTPPEPLPDLRTIVLRTGMSDILTPAICRELERDILPAYLAKRRWFSAKDEKILGARLSVVATMPNAVGTISLCEIEVMLPERIERYTLPLAGLEDLDGLGPLPSQLALARLRLGRRVGYLTDAFAVDQFPETVLNAIQDSTVLTTPEGHVQFIPSSGIEDRQFAANREVRRLSAEQSNSSLIYNESIILKIFRKQVDGIHPEVEMMRHLTSLGFAAAPTLLGEVVRITPNGAASTLMIVQDFIRNQGDGWTWTQDWLARTVDDAALTDTSADEPFAGYMTFIGSVGRRLAELHIALALPSDDPAFSPQNIDEDDIAIWTDDCLANLKRSIDIIAAVRTWPTSADAAASRWISTGGDAVISMIKCLLKPASGTIKIRMHGDFHLGQVLVAQGDAIIVDFEGEPARPLSQRRAKGCRLRDVAGLLRSLDYAAAVASATEVSGSATAAPTERRAALIEQWRQEASATFLAAYLAAIGAKQVDQFGAAPDQSEEAMLHFFLIEKAAYEILYEGANRPTWLHIPLRGLARLLQDPLRR